MQIGEIVSQVKPISMGVPQGSVIGPYFSILLSMISLKAVPNFFLSYMLMTLRYSTFDTFGTNQVDIEKSIIIELQNILK